MKSRSRLKYPGEKELKLPFLKISKMEATNLEKPKPVIEEAYQIMLRKIKIPEIMESALRLAMTKREERQKHGFLSLTRSLSRSAKKEDPPVELKIEKEKKEEKLKEIDRKALWNRARFLALMRAKRGTRKWAVAKQRIENKVSKGSESFWFQAKNMVFAKSAKIKRL